MKGNPDERAVLMYQSGLTRSRPPSPTQAMLLSLPGLMLGAVVLTSVVGLRTGAVTPCSIVLLWLASISISLAAFAEYRGLRPKPWYVLACLSIAACVIAMTLLFITILILSLSRDW